MRPTQDFTAKNLFLMKGRKVSMSLRKDSPNHLEEWLALCENIEERIALGNFRFEGLFLSTTSSKPALATSCTADALVLRKINDNIRRAYGIRQTQRDSAITVARSILGEWTPKGIVTVDLKSCFETITPAKVLRKLTKEARVSTQTIHLLDLLFKQALKFGRNKYSRGLPRGILISSTLAELFLAHLDRRIEQISGVYFYVRYVDDLLAICSRPSSEAFSEIAQAVSDEGLAINASKSIKKDAGCLCAFRCSHSLGHCPCKSGCSCQLTPDGYDFIDYLGYRLIFNTGKKLKKNADCYAMIAPKKVNKIKTRVALSFLDFDKNFDLSLLIDRIRYLTTNVKIDRSLRASRLHSGVAYTYQQYCAPPDTSRFYRNSLESLDKFLRTKVRMAGRRHRLSYMQRRELKKHSFSYGHSNKHRSSFTAGRTQQLKECWASGAL